MSVSSTRFLLAAKHAEIQALGQLVEMSSWVGLVVELVHQLQRERGISNIYLGTRSLQFPAELQLQQQVTEQAQQQLLQALQRFRPDAVSPAGSSRLLSALAIASQGLEQLLSLRQQIESLSVSAQQATEAFSRLIAALLAVVTESAELACNGPVSRAFVALVNVLQAKEAAGQERAWGAFGFASGQFSPAVAETLARLQQQQQQSLANGFAFADVALEQAWQEFGQSPAHAQFERLQRLTQQLAETAQAAPPLSDLWYQLATSRIDILHQLAQQGLAALAATTQQALDAAEQQYSSWQQQLPKRRQHSDWHLLTDPSMPGLVGADSHGWLPANPAEFSVYSLLREQASHIQQMQQELDDSKRALHEQKQIDRAKLILMQHQGCSEEQAYRTLQTQAMQRQLPLAEVARQIIALSQPAAKKTSASPR